MGHKQNLSGTEILNRKSQGTERDFGKLESLQVIHSVGIACATRLKVNISTK